MTTDNDIDPLQQEFLRRMRAGEFIRTAHKEGGTVVAFTRGVWRRSDYGESNTTQTFRDDRAFLDFVREHFRWEVSRDVAPAELSEVDAWKALLRRLESGHAGGAASSGTSRGVLVWGLVVATSFVLVGARVRAELFDRPQSPSIAALALPAAVVLVLALIVGGVWLRRNWK